MFLRIGRYPRRNESVCFLLALSESSHLGVITGRIPYAI